MAQSNWSSKTQTLLTGGPNRQFRQERRILKRCSKGPAAKSTKSPQLTNVRATRVDGGHVDALTSGVSEGSPPGASKRRASLFLFKQAKRPGLLGRKPFWLCRPPIATHPDLSIGEIAIPRTSSLRRAWACGGRWTRRGTTPGEAWSSACRSYFPLSGLGSVPRNYMMSIRLEEDYAYEEAISTAFEGYKRDMEKMVAEDAQPTPIATLVSTFYRQLRKDPAEYMRANRKTSIS